ncbi:hypothetical protein GWI72_12055 [Microvirga tunisiensis]|uniref:Uncharacterized protein n=1 Tax=Pannonibacter tanglangensis TaxID=2750084 RepID=A0A7X5J9J1_9HYPH|nr:hypothetical protein [Pannonibacter sp. XCT-53]NBN79002.1 hypothetical protein [Pannonibacter sp. XCT-53]
MSNISKTTGETVKGVIGGAVEGALGAGEKVGRKINEVVDAYGGMREAQDQQARAEREAAIQERVVEEKRRNPGRSVQDIRDEVERGG